MSIDPLATVGLTVREVRSGNRDGAATKIAVLRRTYPVGLADLWDAVTNPERIPRWFLPVSGELKPGGRYQTEGNAGGVIERCEPPETFTVTWEFGPMMSWLTVALTADGDGTQLELLHEAPVDPEMWGQFGPGAVGVGWDLALYALGRVLDGEERPDQSAGPGSPAYRELVTGSSQSWQAAAEAGGIPAAEAKAAAERTTAFYAPPASG
jgi:uncharacterized protein YndB with AHSA1/START domain